MLQRVFPVNEGIELHDSKMVAVTDNGGEVIVSFSPAYIHHNREQGRTVRCAWMILPDRAAYFSANAKVIFLLEFLWPCGV